MIQVNRAIAYFEHGDPSVLQLVEQPILDPGPREVRIRLLVSGVNPTDCKTRRGDFWGGGVSEATVPNHDGAGIIDAVGPDVIRFRNGDRVWVTLAGYNRPTSGTAQHYTVVPAERVFPLPNGANFELGASIGIPACTAHRALTVAEDGPNAAIQLARWAGAHVVATVSTEEKAGLAKEAGAHHVVNYRNASAGDEIHAIAPNGVDLVVEVAAGANTELDLAVLRPRGTIAIYGTEGHKPFAPDVAHSMGLNARYQFVLLYTVGWNKIAAAASDINLAIEDGSFRIGDRHGLPLHRFPLQETEAAHRAVEDSVVGKVLVTTDGGE
jgi:NADPH2:quinone reductase